MLSMFKKSAPGAGFLDTTLRPTCFGIDPTISAESAKAVGPDAFKKYEHALYVCAQLSRIVYCDTGIMWHVLKHLGRSNDIVNKVISAYDAKFAAQRKTPITSQAGDGTGRPAESYSLTPSTGNGAKFGTYIATPGDMTLLVLNGSKVAANPNSIFKPSDVFITFKGSSTMKNLKHDLLSQFTPSDMKALLSQVGIESQPGNMVTGAFVKPILKAWSVILQALRDHVKAPGTRLFLTGHSLGGAYTTLFAFILCEGRKIIPELTNVSSIHVISFGAPTIVGDKARNTFNAHLDSGFLTLDRVVSQKVASRSAATQMLVGGMAGPNDVIPNVPVGFSHPGFRPLATEMNPESGGRPYSIDNIRKLFGIQTNTRYRDQATWPFQDDMKLGDRANAAQLNEVVKGLTGAVPPSEQPIDLKNVGAAASPVAEDPTVGGALGQPEKTIYETATKTHMPNFVSVQGSVYAYAFAHAEYLGMFFFGGFRLPGMKNPANTSIANFGLFEDGVKINYSPKSTGDTSPPAPEAGEEPTNPTGGARKRKETRRKQRKAKKTRRSRR